MSTVSTNRKNKHISQEWSSIAVLQKVRGRGKARTERLQNDNNEQLDCLIPSAKKWEYTGNHEGIKFNKQMSWQPILSVPLPTHIDTQYFQNVLIYGSQWAKRGYVGSNWNVAQWLTNNPLQIDNNGLKKFNISNNNRNRGCNDFHVSIQD